jgi:hypothetical protein
MVGAVLNEQPSGRGENLLTVSPRVRAQCLGHPTSKAPLECRTLSGGNSST